MSTVIWVVVLTGFFCISCALLLSDDHGGNGGVGDSGDGSGGSGDSSDCDGGGGDGGGGD